MVFTANAGVVFDQFFVPARFKYKERRGEEPFFESWFRSLARRFVPIAGFNEGAGDLLFWTKPEGSHILFAAYGFRTDRCAHSAIAEHLQVSSVSLDLIDPRFYHLDTCFCPLPGGRLLWYPPAFAPASAEQIMNIVPSSMRYEVSADDAGRFACNAVAVPGHVVLNECGPQTEAWLNEAGFKVHRTPLGEFMKAGGAAKCLTLRIDSGLL
jgi:N-dimethylarginine dimethylaminohydrolase